MSDPSGTSHFQSLFDVALQDYEKKTGTKLADHPLARQLESCDSVESVAALLQQQAQGLSKSRGDDGKVMTSLMGVVHVLYTLSPALGEAVSLPFPPAKTIFAGLAILLSTVKDASGSYETLADLLESIEHFLSRLDIYAKLPLTTEMAEVLVKIMVELLSVIALVTKQVRQKRPIKLVKKLFGENEVGAALQRLDRLTQDEARTTAAQTLEVVYGLVQNMRAVMDYGQASIEGVQDALEHLQQNASRMNKPKRDRLRRDIRNWLSPPDPTKNHNIARGSHHSGTATWFIHGTTFSEWKYSGSNSLLWVNGKPGAGKSILCSTIIEDIETMRKRGLASLAYFYCDFRDDQKKDRRGLLTSLLFQLCDQSDSYATVLSNFYSTHRRGAQGPPDDALTQCLKEMLSVPDQAPVYIILDALDECPNTSAVPSPRTKVLTLLQGLVDSQLPNLHICVTSRPEPDITLVLGPLCSHSVSIHGEKGQRQDIDDYIKSVVHTDPMMQKWSEEDKQLVIDVLTRKADGMFRWVYCQLVYLGNCLPGRIRRALDQLPESLDETYERTLRDIDGANFELAHCLLQCVSVASRPLRVGELTEFLAFDFEAGPIPEFLKDWRPEDPIDAVLSTCRSLLAVVDVDGSSFIQFSHFSVKEFLTSTRLAETKDAISRRYHVDMTRAHTLVAQACLGILLHLDDEYVTSGSLETFPLAEYAALHWLGHAQYENVSGNIQEGTKRLFDPSRRHLAVWLWICDLKTTFWRRPQRSEKPSKPRGTSLHYAAVCGLQDVVKFLLEEHVQVVDARGFYRNETPLSSACRSGHLEVVRVLLEYDANAKAQDARKSTPLHRASEGGHLDVVRLLIKYGADASAQDVDKSTPLHGASQGGHLDVARLLLEQGANAKAQDADISTPLHWASQGGHLDIAQVLLEHGADARAKDGVQSTPLHGASQGGHLDVAQVLLERGADATAQDEDKWTPLHRASEGGHLSAVRVLLKHGADAKAQDVDKWTPLHRASQRGRLNVARELLEHGADAGAPTKQKWTPLHWASQGGHLGVARLLLEFGADARAKTKHKWTALHWAAERGHLDIARVLLEYGADASAQNDKNWTPFQEASEHGHRGVMQLLMEHGAVELGFNQYGVGGAA